MSADFARTVAEGYLAPRRSMRRLLDGGYGLDTALSMLALGYLIESALVIVFGGTNGGLGAHLMNVAWQIGAFFMISGLIQGVGRAAGGKGTLSGAQLVVGWHAFVTSPLSPMIIGFSSSAFRDASGAATIPAGFVVLAFAYVAASFWLMANYVAELHQFRSILGVLAALVGLTFACAVVLISLVSAFAPS